MTVENELPALSNQAILASAGTGKTFRLAMRFIALLHYGVDPSSIAAITFTDKAAGEIFDKIVTEMIGMSVHPERIRERADAGLPPEMTGDEMLFHLRMLLTSRRKLQIGTIDSFFFSVIQSFPLECGIAGAVSMIQASDEKPRLMAMIELVRNASAEQKNELREYLKAASYNAEKSSLAATFADLVSEVYPLYLEHPEERFWCGDRRAVWSAYDPAAVLAPNEIREMTGTLAQWFDDYPAGIQNKLYNLLDAAAGYCSKRMTTEEIGPAADLFGRIRAENEQFPFLPSGESAEFKFNRGKVNLSGDFLVQIQRLYRHIITREFEFACTRTSAIFHLLRRFDRAYARVVRGAGLLTFQDIPFLLRGGGDGSGESVCQNSAVLFERTDARIDHYMMDEFQDTSTSQWQTFEPLIDEIFQAPDRFRSFFYVGDIKQSIYQWRNGNPRLFHLILNKYSPADYGTRGIVQESIARSFRSSLPVIETVNRVFLSCTVSDEDAERAICDMCFQKHESAPSAAAQSGCALAVQMEKSIDGTPLIYRKAEVIWKLLRETDPFSPAREKPLTVGILVRKNDVGAEYAARLAAFAAAAGLTDSFRVTLEGKNKPQTSMAFAVLSRILLLAAHPGDSSAASFLTMLRLDGLLDGTHGELTRLLGYPTSRPLTESVRAETGEKGFSAFVRRFTDAFSPVLGSADLTALEAIASAARAADCGASVSIDDFLDGLSALEMPVSSLRNTVQIMTVHKAKGLDFDMVILPETAGSNGIATASVKSDQCCVSTNPAGTETRWIACMPGKFVRAAIPEIHEFEEDAANRNCYENCCNLYVGMTRARRALYHILDPRPERPGAYRLDSLLRDTLDDPATLTPAVLAFCSRLADGKSEFQPIYAAGDPEWFRIAGPSGEKIGAASENVNPNPADAAASAERNFLARLRAGSDSPPVVENALSVRRLEPSRHAVPSSESSGTGAAAYRFAPQTGAELGTRIHEVLSHFPWYANAEQTEDFLAAELTEDERSGETGRLLKNFFASPEIAAALTAPDGPADLWRERPFLCPAADGSLISGCFDRVALERDPDGNCVGAAILDFKSDRLAEPAEFIARHAEQLTLYRTALSRLTGLPESKIVCLILAVRTGAAVKI